MILFKPKLRDSECPNCGGTGKSPKTDWDLLNKMRRAGSVEPLPYKRIKRGPQCQTCKGSGERTQTKEGEADGNKQR